MSSHHDDHHVTEQKPVAFTVPLILASVLILVIVLFLSLCDPKPHHGHEGGQHEGMAPTEAMHHDAAMKEHNGEAAAEPATAHDSTGVPTEPVTAEPAHH